MTSTTGHSRLLNQIFPGRETTICTNLIEVPIRFANIDPLFGKRRVFDTANTALDVQKFTHIPRS